MGSPMSSKENLLEIQKDPLNAADANASDSAVLEVDFSGKVRYASKEWMQLTGVPGNAMVGKFIAEFVHSADSQIFNKAAEEMRHSEFCGGSVTVWASLGPSGADEGVSDKVALKNSISEGSETLESKEDKSCGIEVEAQGILVNVSQASVEDDTVIWLVSKYLPRPGVSVQLPNKLVRTTGFAIDLFAAFLEQLADAVRTQAIEVPTPPQELCRICERFIKTWWFERHHWLCALEHKEQNRVQAALDILHEHRDSLQEMRNEYNIPLTVPKAFPPKHAVHISSPLARSPMARSVSPLPQSQICEISTVESTLLQLIDRCNTVLELDISSITAESSSSESSLYADETAALFASTRKWPVIKTPKQLNVVYEKTCRSIDMVVNACERYAKFVRYRRILWSEVESQVREAIEATIATAESTDATVMIDPFVNSGSSDTEGNSTDLGEDSHQADSSNYFNIHENSFRRSPELLSRVDREDSGGKHLESSRHQNRSELSVASMSELDSDAMESERAVISEDEDEIRYMMNLKRQRPSHSRRSSRESPSLSPHLSPHLSPKLWPSTPSRRLSRHLLGHSVSINSANSSSQAAMRHHSTASILSASSITSTEAQDDSTTASPSIKDYEILKPISRGSYGVVYLARKRLTGQIFAVKVLKKSNIIAKNQVTNIKHERKIMISTATSPYVATLYYSFQSKDYLYLVMEYVSGGDVSSLLKKVGCINESWARRYIAEVIVAVNSLHKQGILHRDLKPDNLLIDQSGHLKLSDFGLSAVNCTTVHKNRSRTGSFASDISSMSLPGSPIIADAVMNGPNIKRSASDSSTKQANLSEPTTAKYRNEDISTQLWGTPDYMSPEIIERSSELTYASDWWAVGCIFFELVYGYPPFNDETPQRIFQNILNCNVLWPQLPASEDISCEAHDFINKLLTSDPQNRLGANGYNELIKHPFLSNVNWCGLFEEQADYIPEEIDDPLGSILYDDRGAKDFKLPAQETNLIYSLDTGCNDGDVTSVSDHTVAFKSRHDHETSGTVVNPQSTSTKGNLITSDTFIPTANLSGSYGFPHNQETSLANTSHSSNQSRNSRVSESFNDEFGNFTYRNLPFLQRANHEVITKIRDEDRRLSFSGSISPLITPHSPSSPLTANSVFSSETNNDSRPGSPSFIVAAPPPSAPLLPMSSISSYSSPLTPSAPSTSFMPLQRQSSVYGRSSPASSSSSSSLITLNQKQHYGSDDLDIEAAVLKNRRRQLRRILMPRPVVAHGGTLNILLGGTNNLTRYFARVDCKFVKCSTANDVCLKANGTMLFDLILLDLPASSPLPNSEIVKIIRGTVNPNRETPILQVQHASSNSKSDERRSEDGKFDSSFPPIPLVDVTNEKELLKALKQHCNWSSHDISS